MRMTLDPMHIPRTASLMGQTPPFMKGKERLRRNSRLPLGPVGTIMSANRRNRGGKERVHTWSLQKLRSIHLIGVADQRGVLPLLDKTSSLMTPSDAKLRFNTTALEHGLSARYEYRHHVGTLCSFAAMVRMSRLVLSAAGFDPGGSRTCGFKAALPHQRPGLRAIVSNVAVRS
jgi:hypothetical protein